MSTPVDVVAGYLDAFLRGDPDEIAGFVAEEFHNEHLSSIASSCVGRDEYRRRLPSFLADFAERSYSVLDVVDQARESHAEVVVRYDFRAVYEGFSIDIPGVMWFTVRGGLITKRIDVWDSGTFLAQIATPD
jgi:ketosteroid isomerase-like protein